METLTPAQRRELRAKAHHLHPVVSIGQHGLTPAVLHEIDVNLAAHELVKIRVFGDLREEREAMLARICEALSAAPVQHLGKLLIVWRPAPKEEPAPRAAPAGKSAARKAPQVRRPRSPLPRAPARPPPSGPRSRTPPSGPGAPKPRGGGTSASGRAPAGKFAARTTRGAATRPTGKVANRGTGVPHGKSSSSKAGASGARRRRKAR
jgi:putative YhbY family RNA-binding protein